MGGETAAHRMSNETTARQTSGDAGCGRVTVKPKVVVA
jgi:hypothetical protein